jgi:hypothetical protein
MRVQYLTQLALRDLLSEQSEPPFFGAPAIGASFSTSLGAGLCADLDRSVFASADLQLLPRRFEVGDGRNDAHSHVAPQSLSAWPTQRIDDPHEIIAGFDEVYMHFIQNVSAVRARS